MNQLRNLVVVVASIPFGLLVTAPARAASLTPVGASTWSGEAKIPSYVSMYIYVPDKVAAKPPIVVSAHACGSNASGQMANIKTVQGTADKNGFILILPDNPGQNCWDVGSKESLTHDGGGDTQAVALMVKYALSKYNGDAARVYIFGGSSGGMLTQAMLAVYPDLFRAGSARAGVPAGCWADGYDKSKQWSNSCAGGSVSKSAKAWGDLVRAMAPSYTGHRPRVQLIQGGADTTISYKNLAEGVKEWTDVLGLSETPTKKDTTKTSVATYDRQIWTNSCGVDELEAWSGQNGTHSMAYEEDAILKFFGLESATSPDPEDGCASGDDAGAGGSKGTGGSTGMGGSKPKDGGIGTNDGGDAPSSAGGRAGIGGNGDGAGGASGKRDQGAGGAAGRSSSGSKPSPSGKGGSNETAGTTQDEVSSTKGSGGSKNTGGQASNTSEETSTDQEVPNHSDRGTGCACAMERRSTSPSAIFTGMLLAIGLFRRRRAPAPS